MVYPSRDIVAELDLEFVEPHSQSSPMQLNCQWTCDVPTVLVGVDEKHIKLMLRRSPRCSYRDA
jgi:hypothetical protein